MPEHNSNTWCTKFLIQVATELVPDLAEFVDERYKEFLKSEDKLGELLDVDAVSAIDTLVERGQWEKALETARQLNVSFSE